MDAVSKSSPPVSPVYLISTDSGKNDHRLSQIMRETEPRHNVVEAFHNGAVLDLAAQFNVGPHSKSVVLDHRATDAVYVFVHGSERWDNVFRFQRTPGRPGQIVVSDINSSSEAGRTISTPVTIGMVRDLLVVEGQDFGNETLTGDVVVTVDYIFATKARLWSDKDIEAVPADRQLVREPVPTAGALIDDIENTFADLQPSTPEHVTALPRLG